MPGKPNAKAMPRASKPHRPATKSSPKAGAKAGPGAREEKPVREAAKAGAVVLSRGNPQIAKADGEAHRRRV